MIEPLKIPEHRPGRDDLGEVDVVEVPVVLRVADVAVEPVRWLWPGRLPRGEAGCARRRSGSWQIHPDARPGRSTHHRLANA